MHLDLTQEKPWPSSIFDRDNRKRSLSAVAPCPDASPHPRQVWADGTRPTAAGQAAHTGGA